MPATLAALEGALDGLLQQRRPHTPPSDALMSTAQEWSSAVWSAAQRAPVRSPGAIEVEQGVALAHRAVFVCGVHRSGTTLVRDLLDGHPSLSVLPSEGSFFTSLQGHLARRPAEHRLEFFGCEWVRRLANPTNRPPYWLLGRSNDGALPYVRFAEALRAWWAVLEPLVAHEISAWPLAALSLAYADASGRTVSDRGPSRWVEKTPGNERFADRLLREFRAARIIHVVRHPLAVLASRKQLELVATGAFRQRRSVLRELAQSYRLAAAHVSRPSHANYCVVRYEDLVTHTTREMDRLARFLDIEPLPILLQPTIAGIPVGANSSFATSGPTGQVIAATHTDVLSRPERMLAAAWLGRLARPFGYHGDRFPS